MGRKLWKEDWPVMNFKNRNKNILYLHLKIEVLFLCSCSIAIENTVHYFLHRPNFSTARNTFLNEIAIVDISIIDQDESTNIGLQGIRDNQPGFKVFLKTS